MQAQAKKQESDEGSTVAPLRRLPQSKAVGLRLDPGLVAAVDRAAFERRSTRSAVLRELILPLLKTA